MDADDEINEYGTQSAPPGFKISGDLLKEKTKD